eukprot:4643-Heterococcus_DN1.PRE.1
MACVPAFNSQEKLSMLHKKLLYFVLNSFVAAAAGNCYCYTVRRSTAGSPTSIRGTLRLAISPSICSRGIHPPTQLVSSTDMSLS